MRAAAFLDMDGVIIEYVPNLYRIKDIKIFDFSADAIKMLNDIDLKVVIATNKPQVAKRLCTEKEVKEINNFVRHELEKRSARIDAIYYCPHYPIAVPGGRSEYIKDCECRKPKTGMIEKAKQEFGIELSHSFIVGDSTSDIQTAKNVAETNKGFISILVKTGLAGADNKFDVKPDFTVANLLDAARLIKEIIAKPR